MTAELIALPILFALSALFSSSETALFSLRRHDLDQLRERGGRAAQAALDLIARPRSLLVAVLFGNLLVNFLLMAVSARVTFAFSQAGPSGVVAGFLLTTLAVLVLGEVLPKAVAVTAPRRVSLAAGRLVGLTEFQYSSSQGVLGHVRSKFIRQVHRLLIAWPT